MAERSRQRRSDPLPRPPLGEPDPVTVARTLTGRALPDLTFPSHDGTPARIAEHGPLILYLYPGASECPGEGPDSALADAEQHRGMRDSADDWLALNVRVLGLSSEPQDSQARAAAAHSIAHPLLSDSDLLLARALHLPTCQHRGSRVYRRLTMFCDGGVVEHVWYPVERLGMHAWYLAQWLRAQERRA